MGSGHAARIQQCGVRRVQVNNRIISVIRNGVVEGEYSGASVIVELRSFCDSINGDTERTHSHRRVGERRDGVSRSVGCGSNVRQGGQGGDVIQCS